MEKFKNINVLDDTNTTILSTLLKVFFFFTPLLAALSLSRIPKLGFLPVMGLHLLLSITLISVYIFRNKLSYNVKGTTIIGVFYFVGIGGVITHSFILYGVPGFILGTVFCTIFFSKKTAHYLLAFQCLTLSVCLAFIQANLFQQIFEIICYILIFNYYVIFAIDKLKSTFTKVIVELEEKESVLQEALNSKSKFLALMSHEIRTPLNGIILGSNEIGDIGEENQRYLDIIKKSGTSLLSVVNDILDISKLEVQKFKLVEKVFSLQDLLKSLKSSYTLITEQKGIEFKLINDLQHSNFMGDSIRIEQILKNLLNNSVKFTSHGSITLSVSEIDSGFVEFRIVDTGIGVTEDKLEQIFDEFEQEEISTAIDYGGTGLGLSIVKKIVELMEGRVDFTSVKEKGTSVVIKIPMSSSNATIEKDVKQIKKSFIGAEGVAVLIAEDDPTNTFLLKSLLAKLGLTNVVCVVNGQECLDQLEQAHFDLLLLDIRMPVLDGLATTQLIRKSDKSFRDIPIIGASANAFIEDKEAALKIGMNDYIMKPIQRSLLFEKIETLLQLK